MDTAICVHCENLDATGEHAGCLVNTDKDGKSIRCREVPIEKCHFCEGTFYTETDADKPQ